MSKGIWVKSKNKVVDKSRKRLKILDRMVNQYVEKIKIMTNKRIKIG